MNKTTLILLTLAALLAAGCYRSGKGFEPFADGLTPDQVRAEMQRADYDYALVMNFKDYQLVTYGRHDSALFHFVETFVGDTLGLETLESDDVSASIAYRLLPLKGGNWRIVGRGSRNILYKLTAPKVTAEGVAFDLKTAVITDARCLFLSRDRSVETEDLFNNPDVQAMVDCAYRKVPGGGIYTDTFEVDTTLFEELETSEECVADVLASFAQSEGFNAIEVSHSTDDAGQHDSCSLHAVRTFPRRAAKCYDAMGRMQEVTLYAGMSFSMQHHADENSHHTGCEIHCYKEPIFLKKN